MNTNKDIDEELKAIAPTLAGIPKVNPYTVPMNYFERLDDVISRNVMATSLEAIPKENPFEVPANYFETLPKMIEKRIAGMQLEGIPKENPFEVPAGYFERLDSQIIDKVIASRNKKGFDWIGSVSYTHLTLPTILRV